MSCVIRPIHSGFGPDETPPSSRVGVLLPSQRCARVRDPRADVRICGAGARECAAEALCEASCVIRGRTVRGDALRCREQARGPSRCSSCQPRTAGAEVPSASERARAATRRADARRRRHGGGALYLYVMLSFSMGVSYGGYG